MSDETTPSTIPATAVLTEEEILTHIAAGEMDWSHSAIYTADLSHEFILAHAADFITAPLCTPIDLYTTLKSKVVWNSVLTAKIDQIPEATLEECLPEIVAANATGGLFWHQTLSETFLNAHLDIVDWTGLCYHQRVSIAFLEANLANLVWQYVCFFQPLTAEFVATHQDKISWKELSSSPVNGHLSPKA
jgi:hypothetical protein